MKYLKKYILFLEEADPVVTVPEGTDDIEESPVTSITDTNAKNAALKNLKKKSDELNEFKQKRTTIENIFKDPKVQSDKQLDQELQTKIYKNIKFVKDRNKTLKDYESVLRSERRKNKLFKSIKNDEKKIRDIKKDVEYQKSLLDSQKDDSDKDELANINKQLAELDTEFDKDSTQLKSNIQKNTDILKRDIINWQNKKVNFQRDINTEIEKTKSLIAKLQK